MLTKAPWYYKHVSWNKNINVHTVEWKPTWNTGQKNVEDLGSWGGSTHVHQQNWMEGVMCIFALQDSSVPFKLTLGTLFLLLYLYFFLCNILASCYSCSACSFSCLVLHPKWCSKMLCSDMLGKWLTEFASNGQWSCRVVSNALPSDG